MLNALTTDNLQIHKESKSKSNGTSSMRHLLTLSDVSTEEINEIFAISQRLKSQLAQGNREPLFAGHVLGLLFEKPSLRTRVSFEAAMSHLGGTSLFLGKDVGWGTRETAADFSRVLSQYVDAIVCRTHEHSVIEELARYAACPVINGLTKTAHPCQALADLLTLKELKGTLAGQKLAYIGDGNNVARSLAIACAKLDVSFTIASPEGYELPAEFVAQLAIDAPGSTVEETHDPAEAVDKASAVYTDVWSSMGDEAESDQRNQAFAEYQVNEALMARAPSDAAFLHCLPAHRGEEVTDGVMDSPNSAVVQQAANRMHVQKGVLVWLLGSG